MSISLTDNDGVDVSCHEHGGVPGVQVEVSSGQERGQLRRVCGCGWFL